MNNCLSLQNLEGIQRELDKNEKLNERFSSLSKEAKGTESKYNKALKRRAKGSKCQIEKLENSIKSLTKILGMLKMTIITSSLSCWRQH